MPSFLQSPQHGDVGLWSGNTEPCYLRWAQGKTAFSPWIETSTAKNIHMYCLVLCFLLNSTLWLLQKYFQQILSLKTA